MQQAIPFALRIFVADGDPDGLRIVDKSNWIGKVLVFAPAWSLITRESGKLHKSHTNQLLAIP